MCHSQLRSSSCEGPGGTEPAWEMYGVLAPEECEVTGLLLLKACWGTGVQEEHVKRRQLRESGGAIFHAVETLGS